MVELTGGTTNPESISGIVSVVSGNIFVTSGVVGALQSGPWAVSVSGSVQVSGIVGVLSSGPLLVLQSGLWGVTVSNPFTNISGGVTISGGTTTSGSVQVSGIVGILSSGPVFVLQSGVWAVNVSGSVQISGIVLSSGPFQISGTVSISGITGGLQVTSGIVLVDHGINWSSHMHVLASGVDQSTIATLAFSNAIRSFTNIVNRGSSGPIWIAGGLSGYGNAVSGTGWQILPGQIIVIRNAYPMFGRAPVSGIPVEVAEEFTG